MYQFGDVACRDSVDYSFNEDNKRMGVCFIYNKYGFYKPFCNAFADVCKLLYLFVVRYDESCLFLSVPKADFVNRISINCIDKKGEIS